MARTQKATANTVSYYKRHIFFCVNDRGLGADAIWLDIQHLDGYRTFTWDPVAARSTDDDVNRMLRREYRAPWVVPEQV